MTDFLKANPFVSMEQYKWELTVPQIRIMAYDSTHIDYSNRKNATNNKKEDVVYINSLDDVRKIYGDSAIDK